MKIDIVLNVFKKSSGKTYEAVAFTGKAMGNGTGSSGEVAAGRAVQELIACGNWDIEEEPKPEGEVEVRYYISAGKRMGEHCKLLEKKGVSPEGDDVWLVQYESDAKQGRENMRFLSKV